MRGLFAQRRASRALLQPVILVLTVVLGVTESTGIRILPEPANCTDCQSVVRGQYVQITTETSQPVSCSYSLENSPGNVSAITPTRRDQFTAFLESGKVNYRCSNLTGSFQVVETRHQISLCSNCASKDLVVRQGDLVSWTFVDRGFCSLSLTNVSSCNPKTELPITGQSHVFDTPGVYHLQCRNNCTLLANITVQQEGTNQTLLTCINRFSELIYSHAGIMAFTFGFLLPFGALLASFKIHIAHMVIQPLGLLLAIVGLALSVTFKTMNNQGHFQNLHSIFGFILILLAALVQPVMRLLILAPLKELWESRFAAWHKRLGIAILFFGMSNIFLGMIVLPETPNYVVIIYGVWVAIAILIYVLAGAYKRQENRSVSFRKEFEEAGCQNCSPYRTTSDAIALNRIDGSPSKLSKGVISDSKFVRIRKTSMDILAEVKPSPNLQVPESVKESEEKEAEEEEEPKPRTRKVSNVHFALTMAAQHTPPVPHTPPVEHKTSPMFAFTNRVSLDHTIDREGSSSEEEDSCDSHGSIAGSDVPDTPVTPATPFSVEKFNVRSSVDSITSQGSIRITRHSNRAHTKADEVFQRSSSMRVPKKIPIVNTPSPLAVTHQAPHTPPPAQRQESNTSRASSSEPEDMDNSIKPWPESSNRCPLHQNNAVPASDVSPLQQRRMRKTAIGLEQPDQTALLLPPPKTTDIFRRSPSRSPTRKRTQRDMLVDNALQSVMSMSEDAIVCANAQGELVFWSAGAVKMFGYTPGEAIGSSLQMIMPLRYKERHQGGINRKTEEAIKYIRKHGSAPEEQKHARLYAVHGMSKTGNEFAVDVVVSSFVIEGDIFYTGIITEVNRGGGLVRNQSLSALSTETEIREKHQKAMAIGAQMKISHKLRSAEHISKNELKRLLEGSLTATEFEVTAQELNSMVDGILKAGDKDNNGVIKFVDLIDLLSKHRLYISDSGLIAKYGKTKAGAEASMKSCEKFTTRVADIFSNHLPAITWTGVYVVLNFMMLLIGMLTASDQTGWARAAFGTGPVLSMNCVLVLLPVLYSMINAMRGNMWLNKVLPLRHPIFFHLLVVGGILFWTFVHLVTHLGSFALDGLNGTIPAYENFGVNLVTNLNPTITGLLVIAFLVIMMVSSIPPLQSLCQFIGFHVIHWMGMGFIYLLLIVHGTHHFNPSFWKWLLPVVVIFAFERIYRFFVVKKYCVTVTCAAHYDELSRVGKVEVIKPKYFHFTPGQYVLLKIPWIGPFSWHVATISCSPKENRLTFFLPWKGDRWLQMAFKDFKNNPQRSPEKTNSPTATMMIRGPYGLGTELLFDQKFAVLVCGGNGPHICKAIIQKFLQYRRASACNCGCHPVLSKLYFVWATPSGNDFEWFTDYLSEISEDEHLQKYLDIRVFLTNINSPPDELASALLHLGLKTADSNTIVKRPSLPQLNNLHTSTSYGFPDFEALLDFVSVQHATSTDRKIKCGVFTIGELPYSMISDLKKCCKICSEKTGPKPSAAELMASPYRKRSIPEPEEIAQIPKEWHIEFKHYKITT